MKQEQKPKYTGDNIYYEQNGKYFISTRQSAIDVLCSIEKELGNVSTPIEELGYEELCRISLRLDADKEPEFLKEVERLKKIKENQQPQDIQVKVTLGPKDPEPLGSLDGAKRIYSQIKSQLTQAELKIVCQAGKPKYTKDSFRAFVLGEWVISTASLSEIMKDPSPDKAAVGLSELSNSELLEIEEFLDPIREKDFLTEVNKLINDRVGSLVAKHTTNVVAEFNRSQLGLADKWLSERLLTQHEVIWPVEKEPTEARRPASAADYGQSLILTKGRWRPELMPDHAMVQKPDKPDLKHVGTESDTGEKINMGIAYGSQPPLSLMLKMLQNMKGKEISVLHRRTHVWHSGILLDIVENDVQSFSFARPEGLGTTISIKNAEAAIQVFPLDDIQSFILQERKTPELVNECLSAIHVEIKKEERTMVVIKSSNPRDGEGAVSEVFDLFSNYYHRKDLTEIQKIAMEKAINVALVSVIHNFEDGSLDHTMQLSRLQDLEGSKAGFFARLTAFHTPESLSLSEVVGPLSDEDSVVFIEHLPFSKTLFRAPELVDSYGVFIATAWWKGTYRFMVVDAVSLCNPIWRKLSELSLFELTSMESALNDESALSPGFRNLKHELEHSIKNWVSALPAKTDTPLIADQPPSAENKTNTASETVELTSLAKGIVEYFYGLTNTREAEYALGTIDKPYLTQADREIIRTQLAAAPNGVLKELHLLCKRLEGDLRLATLESELVTVSMERRGKDISKQADSETSTTHSGEPKKEEKVSNTDNLNMEELRTALLAAEKGSGWYIELYRQLNIQLIRRAHRVIEIAGFCFTRDDNRVIRVFTGLSFYNSPKNIPIFRSLLVEEYLRMGSFMLAEDLPLRDIEKILSVVNPNTVSGLLLELFQKYTKKYSEENARAEVEELLETFRRPKIRITLKNGDLFNAWLIQPDNLPPQSSISFPGHIFVELMPSVVPGCPQTTVFHISDIKEIEPLVSTYRPKT